MENLISQQFLKDPRIQHAKTLILETLKEYQRELTEIAPGKPELQETCQKILHEFASYRASKLWFPYLGSGFGRGPLVELLDGSVKYDLICGIGCHYLGHSHPDLMEAGIDAALSDLVMQGNLQQNGDAAELCKQLALAAGLDHCFLTTSGAMANENAFKIIFQKKHPASRILAFDHCFAGRTWSLSQVSDKPSFRENLPHSLAIDYIPFFDAKKPQESTENAVEALKRHLARYPKEHALMLFELVQGENGFYVADREFFVALMTILKEHQITILVDEVQTFARTPALFAYQYFELEPFVDVVTIGKIAQVCATLFRAEYSPKPGLLSQTFISSTAAIRSGLTILKHLQEGNYFGPQGMIQEIHRYFLQKLHKIADRYPQYMQGPYGIGSMVAFTPFHGEYKVVTHFLQKLFEAGVISFIAGTRPTRARFLVPVEVITLKEIDIIMDIVEKTLVAVGKELCL